MDDGRVDGAADVSAESRLWQAVETLRDGIAVFDARLRLVAANRAFLSVFQGRSEVRTGTTYADLLTRASEGVVNLDGLSPEAWQAAMVARLAQSPIPHRMIRLVTGRHVRLEDRWGPAGDLVSQAIDVTRMVERERELEEARVNAEASTRAKSAFLASMSHEIRTPMNGVVGMADLLCSSDLSADQRLYAETIKSSGEALLTIINDVLDYSKIEAEKLRLYHEPFDLERTIHEVMMLVAPAARDKGLTLAVDFDLFLPTTYLGDQGRIRQVLTNLVGNAVKFTRRGHVLLRVVGLERENEGYELHLTVEDTGIGIAHENVGKVFGAFDQVDDRANRAIEGTGLGLAISRRLVEMMGGTIWVDSELGRGSSFGFRVTLPLAEDHPGGDKVRELSLRRALVIDDDPLAAPLIARQLHSHGMAATVCADLDLAAEALAQGPAPDVVLVDPAVAGFDPGRLRQALDGGGAQVPAILMVETLGDWSAMSPAATLRKPVMRSDLYRALIALDRDDDPRGDWVACERVRVLLAEDNRTNQLVFRKMVQGFDIDLHVAANGREVVEAWRSLKPDLIFMDLSMPELDGRDATAMIRAEEADRGLDPVRIVALTAHEMEGTRSDLIGQGFDDHLMKPVRQQSLADSLAQTRARRIADPAISDP